MVTVAWCPLQPPCPWRETICEVGNAVPHCIPLTSSMVKEQLHWKKTPTLLLCGTGSQKWIEAAETVQELLTSPLRLGLPPTDEATELTELMEELLGLWVRADTPIAIRLLFFALAGLVDGNPIRITLWMGAKRPNLGGH